MKFADFGHPIMKMLGDIEHSCEYNLDQIKESLTSAAAQAEHQAATGACGLFVRLGYDPNKVTFDAIDKNYTENDYHRAPGWGPYLALHPKNAASLRQPSRSRDWCNDLVEELRSTPPNVHHHR